MTSIGNKSTLVKSEFCQACARCCKEFICGGFDLDFVVRFLWMSDERIQPRDSMFRDDWGNIKREVIFRFPCNKLELKDGKYFCSVWDKERPDFCNSYPDNCFYNIDVWDTIKIKKMLQEARVDCPGLGKVTVKQVQEMLIKHREEK